MKPIQVNVTLDARSEPAVRGAAAMVSPSGRVLAVGDPWRAPVYRRYCKFIGLFSAAVPAGAVGQVHVYGLFH